MRRAFIRGQNKSAVQFFGNRTPTGGWRPIGYVYVPIVRKSRAGVAYLKYKLVLMYQGD